MPPKLARDQLIRFAWNRADRDVVLTKGAFYGHIQKEHPEVTIAKISLLEKAIQHALRRNEVYQYTAGPASDFFIQYQCPDFEPLNDYIRICFRVIDRSTIIVTTALPVWGFAKTGAQSYEPSH